MTNANDLFHQIIKQGISQKSFINQDSVVDISNKEMRELLGVSNSSIIRYLNELKISGKISFYSRERVKRKSIKINGICMYIPYTTKNIFVNDNFLKLAYTQCINTICYDLELKSFLNEFFKKYKETGNEYEALNYSSNKLKKSLIVVNNFLEVPDRSKLHHYNGAVCDENELSKLLDDIDIRGVENYSGAVWRNCTIFVCPVQGCTSYYMLYCSYVRCINSTGPYGLTERTECTECTERTERTERTLFSGLEEEMDSTVPGDRDIAKLKNQKTVKEMKPSRSRRGTDLFGREESVSGFRGMKTRKQSREFDSLPYASYTAIHWMGHIERRYLSTTGKKYPKRKIKEEFSLVNDLYPLLFSKYKWSAFDFVNFIDWFSENLYSKGKIRGLIVSVLKSEISQAKIEEFDEILKSERRESECECELYFPHTPISSNKSNSGLELFKVLKKDSDRIIGMMATYGLPIYHRFIQLDQGLGVEEATDKMILDFHRFIVMRFKKSDNISYRKICEKIAKNSILWGPYWDLSSKGRKEIVVDWIGLLWVIWDELSFPQEEWWRLDSQTRGVVIIPSVKKFFNTKTPIINCV